VSEMAQQLQATLDTILEKVALLEGRFDKLLTQSLCQLSETAHAKEGEINVELTRRAETVAQAVLCLDKKIGSLEQIYPIYGPCGGQGVGVQTGSGGQSQGFVQQQQQMQQFQQGQAQQFQQGQAQQFQQGQAQQFQQGQAQQFQQGQTQQFQQGQEQQFQQGQAQQFQQGQAQQFQQGPTEQGQVQQGPAQQIEQIQQKRGQQVQRGQQKVTGSGFAVEDEEVEVEESIVVSAAPQQQAQQEKGVSASGFPKLEKTKEKLLNEIKRVVAGPNGERKVITYSQEEAAKMAAAGEELIGEELTEEEAELFYQEMLAEAEAEMSALEMDLDEYQEASSLEDPPTNLVDFANQAADFLEKMMIKMTGIAAEIVRPAPKFIISDEQYLQLMEERVLQERKEREEQRAKDKKARRVGFGANVDVREFEGEGVDDDIGSEYGSEFSDSSDGSSMYSESMASEIPEGWEWSEEHQDYIYVGEDAGNFNMQGEEGGKKGTYVYVEGVDGAEGQYYFVPEGEGGAEFNKEIAAGPVKSAVSQALNKGKGQIPAGATAMTAEQMAGKMPPGKPMSFLSMQGDKARKKGSGDGRDPGLVTASGKVVKGEGGPKSFEEPTAIPAGRQFKIVKKPKTDRDNDFDGEDAAFGGVGGSGQKLSFKKKKKKTDDDEDEGPKVEAPSGAADGAGSWESEMNKKKNKAKRKKSREDERKKSTAGSGGASYDAVKPKILDKVPWEQPPPGVRPPAPVKKHDVPLPKDSKVLGVRPAIEWILKQPGPFCTTRMVYRNSKKTTRPLYIEKAFEDLHNFTLQGLVVGMLFTVKGNSLANTKCFMKCAPAFVSKRYLREFGIDIEEYRENYLRVDTHATKDPYWYDLVDRVKEVHPWISDFPVDIAYGNVEGMTREEMMAALKLRHAEFLETWEAERLAIKAQLDAKSDVRVDETGKIIVKRKFKGTAPGLPHMPKNSWAEED